MDLHAENERLRNENQRLLGGSLNWKGDGPPGVTVLWRGFQHLVKITDMYQIMRP